MENDLQPNTTKQSLSMRKFPYEYIIGVCITLAVLISPIFIYNALQGCDFHRYSSGRYSTNVVSECYNTPDWQIYLYLGIIGLFVVLFLTKRILAPWSPVLVSSETEIRYKRFPYFISLPFIDTLLWITISLKIVKEAQLVIRSADKEKEGINLSKDIKDHQGYKDYYNKIPFEQALLEQNFWTTKAIYKNQKIRLLDERTFIIRELPLTFVYEEDMQQLHTFFKQKNIPFFIVYEEMPDEVNEKYSRIK